uniref:DUF4371 domain-containing protein n=1 Tax=Oryzias latipes TaxID=8090 RepID=A0A3P9HRP4_ORYLA
PKKCKIASECRRFQTRWENEYFFKEINGKSVCLISNEDVALMKEYNVRRYYKTNHQSYAPYTGAKQAQKFKQMAASLQAQQHFFFVLTKYRKTPQQKAIKSYNLLPSMQCLIKVTEVMFPEKVQDFNSVSLSRNTVVRRIEDLSANLKLQLREKACALDFYSIACDESTGATQLLIFLRGVNDNFCCTEELLDMMSLKGRTTGGNIFDAVSEAVEKMGLKWDKLCGVTTDGAPAMTGERKGMASMVCVKVKESGGEAVRMHCIIHEKPCVPRLSKDCTTGNFKLSYMTWMLNTGIRPLHKLSDPLWLADLAFVVDLIHHLNTLNKKLQGKEQLVSHLYAHLKAFCVKLRLFETQIRSLNAAHFPALSEIKSAFLRQTFLLKRRNMLLWLNKTRQETFQNKTGNRNKQDRTRTKSKTTNSNHDTYSSIR